MSVRYVYDKDSTVCMHGCPTTVDCPECDLRWGFVTAHRQLDQIVASFLAENQATLSKTSVLELIEWSFRRSR